MALPTEQKGLLNQLTQAHQVDVETFSHNEKLLEQLPSLIMTVKTWDNTALQQSRARAGGSGINHGLDQKKEKGGELGGLVLLDPKSGKFEEVGNNLYGPRGIFLDKGLIFVGVVDGIEVFGSDFSRKEKIKGPYLHWIHALAVMEDDGRKYLLAGSSKLGTLSKIDLHSHEVVAKWIGWENGFPESHNGALVTTDILRAQTRIAQGEVATVFNKSNPEINIDVLSTPRQASRINGIFITPENKILLTLFSGQLIELDKVAEKVTPRVIVTGLINPHAPHFINGFYWVTNTHRGEVVQLNNRGELLNVYLFSNSLQADGRESSWLQSIAYINGLMVCVDSTKQELLVVDMKDEQKVNIQFPDYPENKWAVQEVIPHES